jgi:hypothetical protein
MQKLRDLGYLNLNFVNLKDIRNYRKSVKFLGKSYLEGLIDLEFPDLTKDHPLILTAKKMFSDKH